MKKSFLIFIISLLITSCTKHERKLDTKLIASKYSNGVVKILLFDKNLEKEKPGYGYLGRGSGFFVTDDGYIFTNRHVVEKCVKGYLYYDHYDKTNKKLTKFSTFSNKLIEDKNFIKAHNIGYSTPIIQVYNGNNENDYKLYTAKVVSIGVGAFDGALLKIIGDEKGNPIREKFTALPIGNSDDVKQGEQLCVFGYPKQIEGKADVMLRDMNTLSLGIMSGNDFVFNSDYGYMKTDAEIHPGNSAGPVFNEDNKVIGIATAKGIATGIGLVGGINGMYYISAIDNYAHQKLMANGLQLPKRSFSINTITGAKQPIKTLEEINPKKITNINNQFTNNSSIDYYKYSEVFFSNISAEKNNDKIPSSNKRNTSFTIDRNKGGRIWIYINNYPSYLNTKQIKILIDKQNSNGKYEKYKDLTFDIKSVYHQYTYFYHDFYSTGKYRIKAYSKENKYINTKFLNLSYK